MLSSSGAFYSMEIEDDLTIVISTRTNQALLTAYFFIFVFFVLLWMEKPSSDLPTRGLNEEMFTINTRGIFRHLFVNENSTS